MYSSLATAASLILALATTNVRATRCSANSSSYDFIIVGGGTAGLALAGRLNQRLPHECILVIEAGPDGSTEPRITIPGNRGTTIGTRYDWNFTVTPQPGLNNRAIGVARGKVLGGSSALNLMTWDRASQAEYDAWEELGNPGWNWESMYSAMLDVETFNRTFLGPGSYGEEGVGDSGPIDTFINEQVPPQQRTWIPAMKSLGLEENLESLDGNPLGVMYQPSNIRRSTYTRSYSPAYLTLANPNVIVLPDTTVLKVNIAGDSPRAHGVTLSDNRVISARKEVILSAGTFQTPQLLELSGIGNSTILHAAGIEPIVELATVGENLQDHLRIQNAYELKPEYTGFDILRFNSTRVAEEMALYNAGLPSLYRYTGSSYAFLTWQSALGESTTLPELAHSVANPENSPDLDPVTAQKLAFLSDPSVPQLELILSDGYTGARPYPAPGTPGYAKQYITVIASIMHPLARGSVHVNTTLPTGKPVIDPRYLSNAYDLAAVVEAAKYMRRVANTAPISDVWASEFDPGARVQSDEEWTEYARNVTGTIYHPVGTAAMLPREDGGVVDSELKVYGVKGLRVVDASVIPVLISAHIQTAVYGIAERAAGIIAGEWEKA